MLPNIVKGFAGCNLLIVNAGVDSHIDDPLGGILTTEQMAKLDRIVFEGAREIGVPVCVSLAGGYQVGEDGIIDAVLRLHDTTLRIAWVIMATEEQNKNTFMFASSSLHAVSTCFSERR